MRLMAATVIVTLCLFPQDGLTPLHCGARSGHEQVVEMLLNRGAPILSKTKVGFVSCCCRLFALLLVFLSLCLSPPERVVSAAHGDAGRPPQLRPAAAAPRRARGRCHQRLPDGAARGRPLWALQSGEGHRGQEGQPQRQGTGEDWRVWAGSSHSW